MRERDGEETAGRREKRSGGEGRPELIDGRHGRHGGSEESEGAPQEPPRTGESKWDDAARSAARGDDGSRRDLSERDDEYGDDTPDSVY